MRDQLTPRQAVMDAQMLFLRSLYHEVETRRTFMGDELPPAKARDTLRYIAMQHNSLLAGSGLDGLELTIPAKAFADA